MKAAGAFFSLPRELRTRHNMALISATRMGPQAEGAQEGLCRHCRISSGSLKGIIACLAFPEVPHAALINVFCPLRHKQALAALGAIDHRTCRTKRHVGAFLKLRWRFWGIFLKPQQDISSGSYFFTKPRTVAKFQLRLVSRYRRMELGLVRAFYKFRAAHACASRQKGAAFSQFGSLDWFSASSVRLRATRTVLSFCWGRTF
jgi:hypothetical protein